MSLFKKIANLISEKPKDIEHEGEERTPPFLNEESKGINDDSLSSDVPQSQELSKLKKDVKKAIMLETKENLLHIVCGMFSNLPEASEMDADRQMIIWLDTDILTFQTYDTTQYRQRILEALVNECDIRFQTVAFNIGKPAEELRCTPVGQSGKVYLQISENIPAVQKAPQRASISIYGSAGSLLKEQYTLSSDEMKEENISAYNIGAGEFPQIPSGYRHNHIAIDDNSQSPMIEKNKYVSRKHAHIGFSESLGFYLQVELDGTRLVGKRTRIFRGEKVIECDNPQAKIPLQNGDLLELGKAVVLKYVQLN